MSNWYCYSTHLLQELVSTKINDQNLGKDTQNTLTLTTRYVDIQEKKPFFLIRSQFQGMSHMKDNFA